MSFNDGICENGKFLIFSLQNNFYAVSVEFVVKLATGFRVTTLPKTPNYFEGITSFNGEVIPVINLEKFIEKVDSGESKYFVVISANDNLLALKVRFVWDIVSISNWRQKADSILIAESSYRQKELFLIDVEKMVSLLL
ncbi:MAG: chemotaxis protein CheW [Pyrinomonadaceae bacterium]|nr:chemotaxis protein CheW [Pyrinomonadaceae bacterium]MCX7639060.1 chemotaxis protein CheW [Pyrinomonadaceae bacterium]MDW8303719.1 chemotaxis protein CheW [Acidobacteriota bacterium]